MNQSSCSNKPQQFIAEVFFISKVLWVAANIASNKIVSDILFMFFLAY